MARAFGSEPGPTAARIGAFLMKTLYQGDLVVSAMFLTATAPNPLVAELARQSCGHRAVVDDVGARRVGAWRRQRSSSCRYVVYRLCPPTLRDTRPAQALAAERLRAMGPIDAPRARACSACSSTVLLLWLTGEWHGVSPTTIA